MQKLKLLAQGLQNFVMLHCEAIPGVIQGKGQGLSLPKT